jgi:hypothetical protein
VTPFYQRKVPHAQEIQVRRTLEVRRTWVAGFTEKLWNVSESNRERAI